MMAFAAAQEAIEQQFGLAHAFIRVTVWGTSNHKQKSARMRHI